MDGADNLIGRVRRVVYFLLGIGVIIDDVISPGTHIASLVAGLVLLGLIPVDTLVDRCLMQHKPPK